MSLSDYAENKLLDLIGNNAAWTAVATPYLKLHTGDPGDDGTMNAATETTRKAVSFGAASGGTMASDASVSWTSVFATETYQAWSLWDASTGGYCLATGWLTGGATPKAFAVSTTDLSANLIACKAHGLAADDRVVFAAEALGTMPTGLTAGTVYWVISGGLTADVFSVSTSQGGAAVDITAVGMGVLVEVTPKAVTAGDTFTLTALSLTVA